MALSPIDAAGHIDLKIRELILRKTPTDCCINGANCTHSTASPSPDNLCSLNFRLCIGISELPFGIVQQRKDCLIMDRNFSIIVRPATNLDGANNRTFVALAFPLQRFNFTSTAIDSSNIFIDLHVFSAADGKLLLFSRQHTTSLNVHGALPTTFQYLPYGNSLVYQLHARCSPGFVGPKCAILCEPPLPTDNYVCTQNGAQCLAGWNGTRCTQPLCSAPCKNGARCIGPDKCSCPTGWEGKQCEKCKPRAGCQNGFCTDEPGKCFCLRNWTGPDCNLVVNKCLERPCKNNGRCTTNGFHGNYFRCFCPPGFIGLDCSISYAICKNATCGPNQHCAPLENNYSCVCNSGFTGPDCEQRRERNLTTNYEGGIFLPSASTRNVSMDASSAIASPAKHSPPSNQDGNEFGAVKALIGACFLLLLLILAILCCGQPNSSLPSCILPRPIRDRTTTPKLGEQTDEDEPEGGNRKGGTTFVRIQQPSRLGWGSTSSANDEDELDSGLGSIHSAHPPIGRNVDENGLEMQQQRRLVHWSSAVPPPTYEESLRTGPNENRKCTAISREAYV